MAQPNYNKLSENFRRVTPGHIQCSIFCGGRRCKYENATSWKAEQMAIEGLYSHWVTEEILAMARPSTDLIDKRKIIEQFKVLGINTVINLQLPGEHASCGNKLEDSGFTYDPTIFMQNEIYFYNFGLKDYGEASLTTLLDMVKVMAFATTVGKIAIHCHAGLGRTGVLIACYLIYSCRVRANDAIRFVRLKRPNAVQTRGQIQCVQDFEQFVTPLSIVFCNKDFVAKEKKVNEFTLAQYLNRQKILLHGYEVRAFRYIPKIIFWLCERIVRLSGGAPFQVGSTPFTWHFIVNDINPEAHQIRFSRIGRGDSSLSNSDSSTQRASTELDGELTTGTNSSMEEDSTQPCVSPDMSSCASGLSDVDDTKLATILGDGIMGQELHDNECFHELSSQIDLRRAAEEEQFKQEELTGVQTTISSRVSQKTSLFSNNVLLTSGSCPFKLKTPMEAESLMNCMLSDFQFADEQVRKQLRQLRIDLNQKQSAWSRLQVETDLQLISALMFEWLEHLKTPILTKEELSHVVVHGANPEACLKKFDLCTQFTLEYLVRFVARLDILERDHRIEVLKKIGAALTHQCVVVQGLLQPSGRNFQKLREGTLKKLVEFLTELLECVEKTMSSDDLGSQASIAS